MTWIGRDCDFRGFSLFFFLVAQSEFMTWIGRDCDLFDRPNWIRTSDPYQNLWPELEGIVTVPPGLAWTLAIPRSEFMTWIGRDCDAVRRVPLIGVGGRSEFMTWIGRDCDPLTPENQRTSSSDQNLWPELEGIVTCRFRSRQSRTGLHQNLWPELEGIVTFGAGRFRGARTRESEFMTWIGRDCDAPSSYRCAIRSNKIRIYDLNWKGLWLWEATHTPHWWVEIRIYDLNWKGLWRCGSERVGWDYRKYQNLWPELEGIVTGPPTGGTLRRRTIRIYDLNWKGLWPQLLGGRMFRTQSIRIYDLNWKGLWPGNGDKTGCRLYLIRIYDLNWKGLWHSCDTRPPSQ